MSRRKQLEKLVRSVAHQGVRLSALDRLLLLREVLSSPDTTLLSAILRQARVPEAEYVASMYTLAQRGREDAMTAVLLELAEQAYGDGALYGFEANPMRELCSWHDWASFQIEVDGWLREAIGPALSVEFERRSASGQLSPSAAATLEKILSR